MDYIKITPPLPEELIAELTKLWEDTFETSYESFHSLLRGAERDDNHNTVYLLREQEQLVGTCHLTTSKSLPQLGGLGEVATHPQFRRQGIASRLCEQARDDFCVKSSCHPQGREQNGEALFLGTVNPDAARVYYQLGWRKLAGANVMTLITQGGSPEEFLVAYFAEESPATITPGTAADRIPMIPLIVCPHDWQVLDANVNVYSTRYATQSSCMGLYPRYEALAEAGRGAWFAAYTDSGRLVGLSTAQLGESDSTINSDVVHAEDNSTINSGEVRDEANNRRVDSTRRVNSTCQVDGFAHQRYENVWDDLIIATMHWGRAHNADTLQATVSVEDEEKRSRFEALGFHSIGTDQAFTLDAREVAAVRLERAISQN